MTQHTLTIELDGHSYSLQPQENLLQGLLQRGAWIRHSCLAGVCRSCRLYEARTQTPMLSCQTQVNAPLTLISQPTLQYEFELQAYEVVWLSDQWQRVDAALPFSLELGQPVLWQFGPRQGRAFQCSASHDRVSFMLPANIDLAKKTLKLADTKARFELDLAATGVVLCDLASQVVAEVFQESLEAMNMAATTQVYLLDDEQAHTELTFKRVDYAFVISNNAVNLERLEGWLDGNRLRVEQPIYLTFSDQ